MLGHLMMAHSFNVIFPWRWSFSGENCGKWIYKKYWRV